MFYVIVICKFKFVYIPYHIYTIKARDYKARFPLPELTARANCPS